jgi:hypothetical protein
LEKIIDSCETSLGIVVETEMLLFGLFENGFLDGCERTGSFREEATLPIFELNEHLVFGDQ